VRNKAMDTMFNTSIMKPIMRMVHGNPKRGRHCWTIMGNTTPPVHEPRAVIPKANAPARVIGTKLVFVSHAFRTYTLTPLDEVCRDQCHGRAELQTIRNAKTYGL
jgi:hypothetical protein